MRLNISRTAAILTATLAVAACGTQHSVLPGAGKSGPPVSFVMRAQLVTAQWDRSPAAHAWRTGLVLLNAADLVSISPNAGFGSQRHKDAFWSGHFRLAARLPAQPLRGAVRWANGARLHLPLLSARAAFAELATQSKCSGPYPCGQLTVTGVHPGAVTVTTSRGPASVPAWQFTVAELGWQASEIAVAQRALAAVPDFGPVPAAAPPGVGGLAAVSADGRTLTLAIATGDRDTAWGAYSYESARTVVVGSWRRDSTGRGLGKTSTFRTARVTLTRPLGARVVLDVASGAPLVLKLQIP